MQVKIKPNCLWIQLLTCEDLLVFFCINHNILISFGFGVLVRQSKQFEYIGGKLGLTFYTAKMLYVFKM